MKKIKFPSIVVTKTVQLVDLEPLVVLKCMLESRGWHDHDRSYVEARNGRLVRGTDVSRHGSVHEEVSVISVQASDAEAFNAIKTLVRFYQEHAKDEKEPALPGTT